MVGHAGQGLQAGSTTGVFSGSDLSSALWEEVPGPVFSLAPGLTSGKPCPLSPRGKGACSGCRAHIPWMLVQVGCAQFVLGSGLTGPFTASSSWARRKLPFGDLIPSEAF